MVMTTEAAKMTKSEALDYLAPLQVLCSRGGAAENAYEARLLGDCVTYGHAHSYVKLCLETNGISGKFSKLCLTWIMKGQKVDSWTIDLMSTNYQVEPHERNNPDLNTGGYYDDHSKTWYNYTPNRMALCKDISDIVSFAL